jgi:peptidoglycan/LPS O-acetylase OafA/YrhL
MKKVFEEVGKGLIAFANIVTALILLKDYFLNDTMGSLFVAIFFFISFYFIGSVFIKKSQGEENA